MFNRQKMKNYKEIREISENLRREDIGAGIVSSSKEDIKKWLKKNKSKSVSISQKNLADIENNVREIRKNLDAKILGIAEIKLVEQGKLSYVQASVIGMKIKNNYPILVTYTVDLGISEDISLKNLQRKVRNIKL